MKRIKKSFLVVLLGLFAIVGITLSGGSVHAGGMSLGGVDISGFADVYYSYNLNTPNTQINDNRTFDGMDNQFALSLAKLVFEKGVDSPGDVGFRVDLHYGASADIVACGGAPCTVEVSSTTTPAAGVAHGHDVASNAEEAYKDIEQAYVSYLAPVGNGLTIDIGKFVTHMGLEVIESIDNWNYTRSYLFGWAIPFSHAGIRGNYTISDELYLAGYIYNGWDNVVENNTMKTFGLQVGVTPVENLSLVLNWIGPESATGVFSNRQVYDIILSYDLDDRTSFMLNYDMGSEDLAGGGDQGWSGFAVYGRHQLNDEYAGVLRYESFDDGDHAREIGAIGATVQEITLTTERVLSDNLNAKLDLRHDFADEKIFTDENGDGTDSQDTVALGLVYSF